MNSVDVLAYANIRNCWKWHGNGQKSSKVSDFDYFDVTFGARHLAPTWEWKDRILRQSWVRVCSSLRSWTGRDWEWRQQVWTSEAELATSRREPCEKKYDRLQNPGIDDKLKKNKLRRNLKKMDFCLCIQRFTSSFCILKQNDSFACFKSSRNKSREVKRFIRNVNQEYDASSNGNYGTLVQSRT